MILKRFITIMTMCLIAGSAFGFDPAFKPAVNYPVNFGPRAVVTADFNGDGKLDFATANSLSNSVSLVYNNGDGTFAAAVDYPVGTFPVALCVIDIDDDGRPDVATANYGSSTISTLITMTGGGFDVAVHYATGTQPTSICTADFNADAKRDLATSNGGSGNMSVLINLNNEQFPTFVSYTTGTSPSGICAADLNADAKIDIAVSNSGDDNVSTLYGVGDGTFLSAVQHSVGISPSSVASSDLNGNGTADIVTSNSGSNTVSVLMNAGLGVFAAPVDYTVGSSPKFVLLADLDLNGKAELAVADEGADSVSVLHNNGNGTFGLDVMHLVGFGPTGVTAGDYTSDGNVDLAVSNGAESTVSILVATKQFKITASAGANGTISPSGDVFVLDSADQAFTITPNVGYHIANVLVDGVSQGAIGAYTFFTVIANHTISASFAINQYTTTATAGPNGTITPSGAVVGNYGTSQSFTIAPNTGHHIVDVVVDGASQGAVTSWSFPFLDANHTINATFAINTYTLTASAGANGSVTPVGITTVNYGTGQTYTISPAACYHVLDVLVDGISVGAVTTYPFVSVANNHTISATFALNVYTITATAGLHGSITPAGAVSADCGSDRSFAIAPDLHYHIVDVLVDAVSVGAVPVHSITNVTGNHSISASFACCIGTRGNANGDPGGLVNVVDLTFLVQFLFQGGPTPPCKEEADVAVNNSINVVDLTTLVGFLFQGGAPPPACP